MKRSQMLAGAGAMPLAGLSLGSAEGKTVPDQGKPIQKPSKGNVVVAVMISPMATVIDFTGPWEVFQDAGYDTFIVSKTRDVVEATNGVHVVPDYTFDDAPQPNVVVVGAQKAPP